MTTEQDRVRFGNEERCIACGVKRGGFHVLGCTLEPCRQCRKGFGSLCLYCDRDELAGSIELPRRH